MFKHIFNDILIGSLHLKNRLAVPPMVSNMFTRGGVALPMYAAYMEARARGGFGLIITENLGVNAGARAFPLNGGIWTDEQRDALCDTVCRVHAAGGKIAAQLYHAGRETSSEVTGVPNFAPSPFQDPTIAEKPRELTEAEIKGIVGDFAAAARRAEEAGFDAVEVHCAHGYLINQFTSPFSNKRTDCYGGQLINRARFMLEAVKAVIAAVSVRIPVFCRISADELVEGGLTVQDVKALCMLLEDAGVSAIDVSFGVFGSGGHIAASYHEGHACRTHYAKEIKKVCSVPIIAVGRINDPLIAESVIASGEADMVAMGRASIADSDLPNKAKNGLLDEIIYCVGCRQGCNGNMALNRPIGCLANPKTGNEEKKPARLSPCKKVLVVGGGLAGMQFAVTAAERGADVTLAEKTGKLGGQWLLAMIPPHKQEYASLIVGLKRRLALNGVKVLMNTEITEADLNKYDVAADATGAEQRLPDIPIAKSDRVMLESEVLSGDKQAEGKAYVCDFGGCAASTAAFLAAQGKEVVLLLKKGVFEKYGDASIGAALEQELRDAGVDIRENSAVCSIEKNIVLENGENIPLGADDCVVLCTAYSKRKKGFKDRANILRIGDASAVRNAYAAVREAYKKACEI